MEWEDFENIDGSENKDYPHAGENAPLLVQEAIKEYNKLPLRVRRNRPLLYWLLGKGTPPYKMSKKQSVYLHFPVFGQRCDNCRFAYTRVVNGEMICSQIRGNIKGDHWCRLWVSGDTVKKK